jgi:CubicO group peptidase (beta-lactamase class C family)
MRQFLTFLTVVCATLSISLGACAQTTDPHIQAVENGLMGPFQVVGDRPWTIQERMAYWHVKALSMAVIQDYKIAWAKAYGWADDSLKIPATTQTLFQAASISK